MIYSRFGEPVSIARLATLDDIDVFERRRPDAQDRFAIDLDALVIVRFHDGGEQLYNVAYLRADAGFSEIFNRVQELKTVEEADELETA